MNKKIVGPWVVASLFFAPLVWADEGSSLASLLEIVGIDAGWQMDPNGSDGLDAGSSMDPNGLDAGSAMDPNGLTGEKGMGLDPNG